LHLKGIRPLSPTSNLKKNDPKGISVASYGELLCGARTSSNTLKNISLVRQLSEIYPIEPVAPAIMETFAELKSCLEKAGERLDDFDLLIAATALNHNLILVSNNTRYFTRIKNLPLENWTIPVI